MADVLGSGPGSPRRRRPRWLTVVAGVAVAAVLALLAVTADRPGRTLAAPEPAPTAEPGSEPLEEIAGDDVDGPPPRIRLLVGGRSPGTFDLSSGRFAPFGRELGPADGGRVVFRRGSGVTGAVAVLPSGEPGSGTLLPDGGPPVRLGQVRQVLPGAAGGMLVLRCEADGCRLAARDRTGVAGWSRPSPPDETLVADTPYGLVTLARDGVAAAALRLRETRTGAELRVLGSAGDVLAVAPDRIAVQETRCEPDCGLLVVRLADGVVTRFPVPDGRLTAAAFSPNGRQLAVGLAGPLPVDYRVTPRSGYAVVLDLPSRAWTPVPGLRTAPGVAPVPVWLPDGLLLAAAIEGTCRFATWVPGDPALTVLPYGLPGVAPGPGDLTLV